MPHVSHPLAKVGLLTLLLLLFLTPGRSFSSAAKNSRTAKTALVFGSHFAKIASVIAETGAPTLRTSLAPRHDGSPGPSRPA
jgi:hypothetical protein